MTVKTPVDLQALIDTYARHRHHYRAGNYNETQLRVEFVDPFFIALGWEDPVWRSLEPHSRHAAARTDHERNHLQRLIDATDHQIDQLVYQLYDLTEEQIAIVEGEVG